MSRKISSETVKRLLKDVRTIIRNPLTDQGIYYIHDELDMLKGYAMIVGPEGTPYFGGYYFFSFKFPIDYPFSPPKVKYMTNNGETRFNPNLYIDGKVCVSTLNTWQGDKWSSCQTISSILLTLCSLLNENPLLNEPGINEDNIYTIPYRNSIEYKNIEYAICNMINLNMECIPGSEFMQFYSVMKELYYKNYDKLLNIVESNKDKEPETIYVNQYNMITYANHGMLYNKFIHTKNVVDQEENKTDIK
jgi:ubiquitin-conjugating enzyme E2 Z